MLARVTLPLALSGDEWIAVAGVSSGVIVGLGSLVFAHLNGKVERAHGERLARNGRTHEQRRLAYVDIARLLSRQRLVLIRAEPLIGPKRPAVPDRDRPEVGRAFEPWDARERRGVNSSQVAEPRIAPRTNRQPPSASGGNMYLQRLPSSSRDPRPSLPSDPSCSDPTTRPGRFSSGPAR
jgi:hypothetical protein